MGGQRFPIILYFSYSIESKPMKKLIGIVFGLAISFASFSQIPSGPWQVLEPSNTALKRHESGFVECDGQFYSLGGRGKKAIEAYNPKTNTWENLGDTPIEFHHFQALSFQHEIYVICAFTGGYPHEKPIENMLIFNPKTKTWREGAKIPADRLRGSAGIFAYKNKIYAVCGIKDGHYDGHVSWFDVFDPKTNTWSQLADAPRSRDHVQAAMLGDKLYMAGGRNSHAAIGKVLDKTIAEVDVYDFKTGTWTTLPNGLPTLRAGTCTLTKYPYVIVLQGESTKQVPAHAEVEALDVRTNEWVKFPSLLQGRHGTSTVLYKNKLYIMAGSANRGGGPELNTMEYLQL